MSVESDLRKDGIEVIKSLDTLKINSIARNISLKICETFPEFGLNQNELFIKFSSFSHERFPHIKQRPTRYANHPYVNKKLQILFYQICSFYSTIQILSFYKLNLIAREFRNAGKSLHDLFICRNIV